RLVVTAAGNLDHDAVVAGVAKAFAEHDRFDRSATPYGLRPAAPVSLRQDVRVRYKETEQANVLLGCPALPRLDERRFALGVLNNALGGGMSSRLFQEIRE